MLLCITFREGGLNSMVTNREQLENFKEHKDEILWSLPRIADLLIIIADELIKVNHYFESERLRNIMSKEIKL